MFAEPSIKQRLLQKKMQIGCFLNMASPISTQIVARLGYDVVLLDHEHSAADFNNAINCMNAALGTGSEVWVRVPSNDRAYIKRILDCGATGIMCPMVNTAEEARELVRACRYPPDGVRGVAPNLGRHTNYGTSREAYMARIDKDLAIMPQIETVEGLENIEEIVAVDGVDIIFVGPFDLSASLGHLGKPDHPVVVEAIERIELTARTAGKALGTLAVPRRDAPELMERGYDLILGGSDVNFLRAGLEQRLKELQAARGERPSAAV